MKDQTCSRTLAGRWSFRVAQGLSLRHAEKASSPDCVWFVTSEYICSVRSTTTVGQGLLYASRLSATKNTTSRTLMKYLAIRSHEGLAAAALAIPDLFAARSYRNLQPWWHSCEMEPGTGLALSQSADAAASRVRRSHAAGLPRSGIGEGRRPQAAASSTAALRCTAVSSPGSAP